MDILDTVVTIVERIGFPALIGLLLYLLLYQLVMAYREEQKRRAAADDRDAELRVKLFDMDTRNSQLAAQNSEQIDLLRKSLEQVSASEALILERNLKAVEDNTAAIHTNTEQLSTMQQRFVQQLSQSLEVINHGQRAIMEHISTLASAAQQEHQQMVLVEANIVRGLTVLSESVQAQTNDIHLLTSAVNAEQQANADAHREQKQDGQRMADEFHRFAQQLESLPEQVAERLRPILEPLVDQVQKLRPILEPLVDQVHLLAERLQIVQGPAGS